MNTLIKQKIRNRRDIVAGLILALTISLTAFISMADEGQEGGARADLLLIDTLSEYGKLERPAALFPHDKHTELLNKEGKDCKTCHLSSEKGVLSQKFKRFKDEDPVSLMELYHDECMGCHKQRSGEGKETGPVTCGDCHQRMPEYSSARQPIGFNHSMHYRHVKAEAEKCENCHHEGYYKDGKKPAPGEKKVFTLENVSNCRDCHGERKIEDRSSMRSASHEACIGCHRKNIEKKDHGPINCAGCHSEKAQAAFKKVEDPPRLKRKQPENILISMAEVDKKNISQLLVRFNHQAHEKQYDTCRVCHHGNMQKCSVCHTIAGTEKSGGIAIFEAMHLPGKKASCIGCHDERKADHRCAGCHDTMGGKGLSKWSCQFCHASKPSTPSESSALKEENEAGEAVESATVLRTVDTIYPGEQIPVELIIGTKKDKYKAVKMPHRKIIDKIRKGTGESKLATFFHAGEEALCQGCHHNTRIGVKPPACSTCHNKPPDSKNLHRPGLTAAYHQQCIGCHKSIGMKNPTKCDTCHLDYKDQKK